MSLFIIFLAVLIGLTLGILGGGGSILALPLLTYVAGIEPRIAIAMSLLIVGITAAFSVLFHHRKGFVNWKVGLIFAPAAMIGGVLGGVSASWFSESFLMLTFAGMMVLAGVGMLLKTPVASPGKARVSLPFIWGEGLLVGAITGLVGSGGGFLVVPALLLWGGLSMKEAVGTSLLVIALKSLAAFSGHMAHVQVNMEWLAIITLGTLFGSIVGGLLAPKLSNQALKKGFATLVFSMSGWIVFTEGGAAWFLVGLLTLGTVAVVLLFKRHTNLSWSSQNRSLTEPFTWKNL